jgi:AcrR family transcriptional regulator
MAKYTLKQRAVQQAETRKRIVEAIVELHKTIGPARTTISAIAERAGVERLTVYRHFPNDVELFRACSDHWRTANPPPDLAAWRSIADPIERIGRALAEVYAYYERTAPMLGNVLRDADLLPVLANQLAGYRQFVSTAQSLLVGEWDLREQCTDAVRAAVGLALSFETWRSLTVQQGLTRSQASNLMIAFVRAAALPDDSDKTCSSPSFN